MGWTCFLVHLEFYYQHNLTRLSCWCIDTIALLKKPVHFPSVADLVQRHETILQGAIWGYVDVFNNFDILKKDILIKLWVLNRLRIFGCKWFYWFSFFGLHLVCILPTMAFFSHPPSAAFNLALDILRFRIFFFSSSKQPMAEIKKKKKKRERERERERERDFMVLKSDRYNIWWTFSPQSSFQRNQLDLGPTDGGQLPSEL